MAEEKRRGWLSRLFSGDKPDPEPTEEPLAETSRPAGEALTVLFGESGSAAADIAETRGEAPLRVGDLPQPGQRSIPDGPIASAAALSKPHAASPEAPAAVPAGAVQPVALGAPSAAALGAGALAPPAPSPAALPMLPLAAGAATEIAFAAPIDLTGLVTPAATAPAVRLRVLVHVADLGDTEAEADTWAGERASGRAVEGLAVTAIDGIDPDDVEYQGLQEDGTLTEWYRGGAYCGSRGARRPLYGCALRLTGPAVTTHRVTYAAVFLDGAEVGPLAEGLLCAAPSGAALEAIYVMVDPA